jgi:ATP-binding cassette, subfamily B, bacterial
MSTPAQLLRERVSGIGTSLRLAYRFREELYPHWPRLLAGLLFSIGYTLMRLAEPWPLKFIFDHVLVNMPLEMPLPSWIVRGFGDERMVILTLSALVILGLAVLRGVFYYYQNVFVSGVGQEVVLAMRRRLFAHLQRLSLNFHNQNSTGDLITRLTGDIAMLRELLVASILSLVTETVILISFAVVMLMIEWRLGMVALGVMPVILGLLSIYSGRIREATRQQRRREGRLASRLQEVLSGIHVVQMFAREKDEDERLGNLNQRSLRSGLKAARLEAELNRAVELSLALATAGTLWFGAIQVMAGRITPGELIVFVAYMQSFHRPLRRISRVAERGSKASTCVERVVEVLDRAPDVRDGWREAPRFRGAVSLSGIEFGYQPGEPVLRGINIEVRPGQTVALVGRTGSGKTTLLSLVPRLYEPTSGVVRIDNQDIRELTLKSLRDQVAVVPQDGMLFGGSIRENIAYGKPEATDREIEAATRAAQIHDFINRLPDGYDTAVGERGVTLSGGQRQRLALARAIVKDAPIVLLDEPTTGLDTESEQLVVRALEHLLRGRTALVIAHRLSTITTADLILVMVEGRIAQQGRHEDLLEQEGPYRDLYELQFAARQSTTGHRLARAG